MTSDREHLAGDVLEELADDVLDGDALREAGRHLASCELCAARLQALRTMGAALRALPLERAPQGFTGSLLRRIDERGPARALKLAGWFSGIVGLLVVGSLLVAVFVATGVIPSTPAADQGGLLEQYLGQGWDSVVPLLGPTGKWFSQHLPASSTMTGLVFTLAVLAGLGLLDRVLGRRFRGENGI